jgi:hypothetical protein
MIGLIYGLRVANISNGIPLSIEQFFHEVGEVANQNTTLLSANLIACAAAGQVDERIFRFVDALFSNVANVKPAYEDLIGWGNTSGRMVLAGIAAGVSSS